MAIIPMRNTLNEIMENGEIKQRKRPYLGYSGVGHKCHRHQWYSFRWCYDRSIPRRLSRIFNRGDIEEPRVIADLDRVGCKVYGDQTEVIGITGHAKGHIDGLVENVPTGGKKIHLLEIKTMKSAMYAKYMKIGLRKFSGTYWQQIHSYMGHLDLKRCLYVVVNKDTEERDFKRIKFEKPQFEEGERIALGIITSPNPPNRIMGARKTFFECKMCDSKDICFGDKELSKSCRICEFSSIEDEGIWSCDKSGAQLNAEDQKKMCNDFKGEEYV